MAVKTRSKSSAATKKKSTAKKSVVKKTKRVSNSVVAKRGTAKKIGAVKTPLTKSDIVKRIAAGADISQREAGAALETLCECIFASIGPRSCGQFKLPGMFNMVVTKKPARKARKGINPFTGEEMMFKAKPAQRVVKIRPLKKLKDTA